jgi:RNA 2',3'-cyclic 3'-phosphodiesterase
MRLFVALDIDAIRGRIARYVEGVREFAPEARWVKEESLHVTLKFIGEQPDSAVEQIRHALTGVVAPHSEISFAGYGFFPTTKAARVFWIGIDAQPELAPLAATIDEKLMALGIPQEERRFSPHLTLARLPGRSGSPRWRKGDRPTATFQTLQQRLANMAAPQFGSMTLREFFLYKSQLSPKGSTYTKLARFSLEAQER